MTAVRLLAAAVSAGALAATVAAGAGSAPATPSHAVCGVERWDVKTLADPSARKVNLRPRPTTVWALTHLRTRPALFGPRRPPVETTTYRITARLVESRAEADQDIHLIVAAPEHPATTMIVEFPASACTTGALPCYAEA